LHLQPDMNANELVQREREPASVSIIVPTYNERDNVAELVARLHEVFDADGGGEWEVVFVDDDSPDGTAEAVRGLAARDARVRCLQRIGRRGLSSACVEGMLSSAAEYLAVIDGDLQHDERILPQMRAALQNEDVDLVVGSRYVERGGVGEWSGMRARMSRCATSLARWALGAELRDPMSGFFMVRRAAFHDSVRRLSNVGFKILLDLFASAPRPLRVKEIPYHFRLRRHGESKLDAQVLLDFATLLLDKRLGRVLPTRFVAFSLVGATGVALHMGIVALLYSGLHVNFAPSQATATTIAMLSNFALNNGFTYRDRKLHGARWLLGLGSFAVLSAIGATANVAAASYLFRMGEPWMVAALAGVLVSALWNYLSTSRLTWGGAH
jgi:dolichol-phosphate mannosyltransferase